MHRQVGLLVCRHVIEHIQDPFEFLKDIHSCVELDTLVFFETPRLEWILQNRAFYDFFYEHCNYFTEQSIRILFARAGFEILDITKAFGEQYQLIFAKPYKIASKKDFIFNHNDKFKDFKSVAIWGAGAKGVTMASILDNVVCVIDINPKKQNCFIPASTLEILSPENAFKKHRIDCVLVMNPNYLEEVKKVVRDKEVVIKSVV